MVDFTNPHPTPSEETQSQFWVVGLGASAGGLEALFSFFSNLPDNPCAAFVVVQHLSPDFQSLMPELLQRRTKLPVRQIEDEMPLQANYVYVLPPGKNLQITHQHFQLLEQVPEEIHYPINSFFNSLAEEQGQRCIGILLSGTGSDGTEGLQAISRQGGVALVQSPETAQFISMPSNAIPSGCVDEILSPRDLANAVYNIVRFSPNHPFSGTEEEVELIPIEQLEIIINILAQKENIDFSHYKISTISRRILHRCELIQAANLENYIRYLENSEAERKLLRQELLIVATSFFRDPPAWKFIKQQVLPEIIRNLSEQQELRIWVAACATGEEAYSLAILVDEAISAVKKPIPVKIFVTDLDINCLEIASRGIYSEKIVAHIPPEYINKYFVHQGDSFVVKKRLREMLIISPHDLTKNAGFSKINIITCRNVLIYMQPQLQQQVLRLLHFSLASKGVLFLGNAETLGALEGEFTTLDAKWKIYRKRREIQLSLLPLSRQAIVAPLTSKGRNKRPTPQFERLLATVFDFCFNKRQITCLLVDKDNQLMHIFYNSAKLLEFPVGKAKLNVIELVLPALRLPLKIALNRAKQDKEAVLYNNIQLPREVELQMVNLRVVYEPDYSLMEGLFIVFFEVEISEANPLDATQISVSIEAEQQLTQLEHELQQTRENLQATIEELEITNEEQQATNEELLASNEELQSTNEELHSVNEELYTVNSEHQLKIQQLTELSNDVNNLLRSTNIGVLFLDNNLKIRKFTPTATQVINIRSADINRPLNHFTHNLNCPDLVGILTDFITEKKSIEKEYINLKTGERLLMRVNFYICEDGTEDGVVVTFINIDELKRIQERLENSQTRLEEAQQIAHLGDWELSVTTEKMTCSEECLNILGISPQKITSLESFIDIIHDDDKIPVTQKLEQLKNEGTPFNIDLKILKANDELIRHINLIGKPKYNQQGEIIQIYGILMDISDRKQAELNLHQQAFYDALTGLPNRALFLDRLQYTLNRTIDYQENASQRISHAEIENFALLYLDLDEFKEINDTQGHLVGDQVLVQVAQRLNKCLRPGDTICRLGGDEFAVILENITEESLALTAAQRIHEALSSPFELNNTSLYLKASIGVTLYQSELYRHQPSTLLLDNADIAMYQAKARGAEPTVIFTPEMRSETEVRVQAKYELQRAIEQEEFLLYYQPILDLQTSQLKSLETLIRWNHPQRGILTPREFLSLLQESSILPSLEKWIITHACTQFQQWLEEFDLAKDLIFSVNVSPQFLNEDDFVTWLECLLKQVNLPPQQLMLEITETALIENTFLMQNTLSQLKKIGIRIALDDFGTGFSSLSHLHRFPLDVIKIDQSFVNAVPSNLVSENIVEGILYLSQKLNLATTAEGIETLQQKQFLQESGCSYGQGYIFSRPLCSDDLISWLS